MTAERILVIDDEPDVLRVCQRVLEEEGFEVEGALNGEEGLRLLKGQSPELVEGQSFDLTLLDVRLPNRDGLDVLSTIQKMDPEMAVVIITGYGTMEMAISALKSGAQDFLLKPFTPKELVTSVQKVLEKKRLIQENSRLKARLPILEISKALMSEVNLERLTQLALEIVRQTLRADRVSLMLLDEERQELSISAALGLPDEVVATTQVKVWQSLAGLAVQRKSPILLPEQAENDPAIQALLTRSDTGAAICLPLMIKDHVLGVLNVSRLVGGAPFRQDDVDLLSILGGQIAVAIENAQLFEQAQREIAERRRAEEELRESEERYRLLFESIGDAVIVSSLQGGFLGCNEATLQRLGYSREEFLHLRAADIIHPDFHSLLKDDLKRIGVGEIILVESVHRCKDRRTIPVEVSARRIEYQGESAILSVVRDITERKQAEEARRESEERFQALVESSSDHIFILDRDGTYLLSNSQVGQFGLKSGESLVGRHLRDVYPPEVAEFYQQQLEQVLTTGQAVDFEHPMPEPNGDHYHLDTLYPIHRDGEVWAVGGICRDITGRKQAEEALRETRDYLDKLIQYANAPIIVWGPDMRITRFNGAFEHLTGYAAEEVISRELSILFPEASRDDSLSKIARTLSGEYWESVEVPILRKDGDIRVALWNSANIYAEDGTTLLATVAQGQDITERKQAEEALRQHAERLRTLTTQMAEVEEAERQRLARELHDQVGQTLTALGINLNIVRSQIPEEVAGLVRSRLDDSLALVGQTTERIRSVMADLRPAVLDDYGLVAALRWYGEQFTSRTDIAVNVQGEEPDPRLPPRVENALFRIAQEALTNVTKHAQATQVTVAVEADDETVHLVIADDGIGFDPAHLARPNERRGWGLLTMTERAEAIGGRCHIESHPTQGTKVTVEVPRWA